MPLIRWEPVPATRLFPSLFDSATIPAAATRRSLPATDLTETDSHYVVRADLPGVAPADVAVELKDDVLTISGSRAAQETAGTGGYRRIERSSGSFRRAIRVPAGVEATGITARFDNGVLEVTVPKPVAPQAHRIAVQAGAAPTEIPAESTDASADAAAPAAA